MNSETNVTDNAAFDFVTKAELISVCEDTERMLTEMKDVINTQAEVIGLHRYILARFVPGPKIAEATTEYRALRERQIESECILPNIDQTLDS